MVPFYGSVDRRFPHLTLLTLQNHPQKRPTPKSRVSRRRSQRALATRALFVTPTPARFSLLATLTEAWFVLFARAETDIDNWLRVGRFHPRPRFGSEPPFRELCTTRPTVSASRPPTRRRRCSKVCSGDGGSNLRRTRRPSSTSPHPRYTTHPEPRKRTLPPGEPRFRGRNRRLRVRAVGTFLPASTCPTPIKP
jgi:hypothetical protein